MAIDRILEQKSANRRAFDHYLRTGQRLTTSEWVKLTERKFNPYHDEIGRFTSAPGVTVSWGAASAAQNTASNQGPHDGRNGIRLQRGRRRHLTSGGPAKSEASVPQRPQRPRAGYESEFVRNGTAEAGHAATDFELRRRQAGLDRLREEAGPNPSAAVRADLDDFQARLDADRVLLVQAGKEADKELVSAFRKVNPVIDVGAATINVMKGDADLDDAIALASVVPIGKVIKLAGGAIIAGTARGAATAARLAKPFATSRVTKDTVHTMVNGTIQRGGAHRNVKGIVGHDSHHIPQNAASPLRKDDGPTIAMERADHRRLKSSRNSKESLSRQREFIEKGDYRSAMEVEIADIRELFGNKYDDAIEQMLSFSRSQGLIK